MTEKQRRPQERGGKFAGYEDSTTHRAVARSLFESRAGTTCAQVAAQMGLAPATIRGWKADAAARGEPWRVQRRKLPELSGRVAQIADQHRMALAELGPNPTDAQKQQVEQGIADTTAAEARALVVRRHRAEWGVVRQKLYEGIQSNDMDKVKLSKLAAETLSLGQAAERKAWGLDHAALGPSAEATIVVVERVEGDPRQAGGDAVGE